ncbi:hypothetical protein [Aquisphaera insulae]|uniref:hypothetical protein n=1 Tax=Aquisphaera insulae TaxID=2712864 RepID=UPI00196A8A16|nr:hypothetical protein [Aquisphaera insulae]
MNDQQERFPRPNRAAVEINRREALGAVAACLAVGPVVADPAASGFRLATFAADVTPPAGHPLMGGGIAPAAEVMDRLSARGFVLSGAGKPVVLAAIDWCEIRNDAFDRWREALAEAADTDPRRVLVACLHQHDAPIADLAAQRLLDARQSAAKICDPGFHELAVRGVAQAVREGLRSARRVTHVGTGQARVEAVASNRRYLRADGRPAFDRMSATRDPAIRDQPEGLIDPWLRTLSFWDGDRPVLALSAYATHPMSHYGRGAVSADFIGMARRMRQDEMPDVFQIYATGCGGNVTAGKYNDGSPANRPALAGRIHRAMVAAWAATERSPIERAEFRSVPLRLEPRDGPGFTVADLRKRLETDPRPFGRCLAALGLAWRARADAGHAIDVPALDLGRAQLLLLPGESYVEYQLLAQRSRPDSFVVTLGYGEAGTGYIPTDRHFEEGDANLADWCWVAPGSEARMARAIAAALGGDEAGVRPTVEIRGVYGGMPAEILDRGKTLADYGINAVWIGSGGLTREAIETLKRQGAKAFAEFNTMHDAAYLEGHPDAAPIGADGTPCPPPDGWQGVCPTHPGYRAARMAAFRQVLRDFAIDGIWLDYHHAHASWEQAEPALPDTCFCARCLARFAREADVKLPDRPAPEVARMLLGPHRDRWVGWRCGVFTDWVRELRDIRDEVRPGALLGTFHCPWSEDDRGGALRAKLAIDLRAQAEYLDVLSPMPYHARFGHAADPAWIGRQVAWLGRHLGIHGRPGERLRIWPIVQLSDWGEPVPAAQVAQAIAQGARRPATGLTAFAWGSLSKDRDKVEELGRAYRALKP